jgi:hypothetical protein
VDLEHELSGTECERPGRLRRRAGRPGGKREREDRNTPRQRGGEALDGWVRGLAQWAILDSNQGPPPYQSGALTS